MNNQLGQLQEKIKNLEKVPLITVYPDNLVIFPNETESCSPTQLLAVILGNCTVSFLLELQGREKHFGELLDQYDEQVLLFARNASCADFIRHGYPQDDFESKRFLRYMSDFPKPPQLECLQRLQLLHKCMQKVVMLSELTDSEIMRKLFGLCASWLHEQKNLDTWKVPVEELLISAKHHIRRNIQRIHNNHERHYRWGKEYDTYFNRYLEQGFCIRTAHGKARKDFIANHPMNNELPNADIPGHSHPALKRYHSVYLRDANFL